MRPIAMTLSGVMLLAACTTSTPVKPDDPVVDPPTTETAHYLAWWAVEEGGHSTALIRTEGDEATVVAEGDGLFIAVGDRLWMLEESVRPMKQYDCSCVMEHDVMGEVPEGCAVERDVTTASMVELDGEGRFDLGEMPDEMEGEYEPQQEVIGSSDGWVSTTTCQFSYACGAAHGSVVCEFAGFDLERGVALNAAEMVEAAEPSEQVRMIGANAEDPVTEETLEGLVCVAPQWNEAGEPSMVATYAAGACYACSDGDWSSYTVTAKDEGAEPLVNLEPAPKAVVDVWGTTRVSRGWSRVDPDEVDRVRSALQ